jgi:hypothetical protein
MNEQKRTEDRRLVERCATFDGQTTFGVMAAAFDRALARHPGALRQSFYTFAGRTVRIRVVGAEMAAQIVRPFLHLQIMPPPDGDADLTVDLWDENSTGIRRQVTSLDSGETWPSIVAVSPDEQYVAQQHAQTLTCFDRKRQRVVGCVVWSEHLSMYERGKPLTRPLIVWHNDRNLQIVHAGLVGRGSAGVLFAGQSGAGKSTCALTCLAVGFDYASEDYVAIETVADGFLGHSLYNSVFLEREHLDRFPHLVPHAITGGPREKSLILLADVDPHRLARVMSIRALVFPRVTKRRTSEVRPASPGEALLMLAHGSLLTLPNIGVAHLDLLGRLVERLPSYRLELGHDLKAIPERISDILAAASDRGTDLAGVT